MKKMKKFADGGELGSGMGGLRSAMDAMIAIPGLDLALMLDAIYRRVDF
jgi:hypothetical protein